MGLVTGTSPASGNIGVNDAPNGIVYNVPNRIIPNSQAGIGDIVFENSSGAVKIIAGGTYTSAALTALSGYTLLGVIYGFEAYRSAMIVAPTGEAKTWASTGSTSAVNIGSISGITDIATAGKARNCYANGTSNGKQAYLVMNVSQVKEISNDSALTGTMLHPKVLKHPSWSWVDTAIAQMSLTSFNNNTNGAKDMYGTYEAYLSQLKPMGNGGGGVFDKKWHVGREYTRILANNTTHAYAPFLAAQYCWNYGAGSGKYWLPDMVELRQLMEDSTLDRVNVALGRCGQQISKASYLWSSVRSSATHAWIYNGNGFSLNHSLGDALLARPVTLVKI